MSDIVLDDFAPFTFLTEGRRGANLEPADRSWVAPSWIGEDNRHRLEGYKFLEAMIATVSRQYQRSGEESARKERREYGDAALLVEAAVNALIGEDVAIVVADAETNAAASARQDELRAWADKEAFVAKMFEGEFDAVGLGDTVYALGWSNRKQRVRMRVYNPGFYFPVLGDDDEDDFPRKLHLGWEFDVMATDGTKTRRVRRITWELVDLFDSEGTATGEQTCLMSNGTWALDEIGSDAPRRPDDFADSRATWDVNEDGDEVHNLDLGVDIIPVVHIPNTPASQTHFGRPLLLYVLQLLIDIQLADSDIDKASSTTALPMIGVKRDAPVALSQAEMAAARTQPGYGEHDDAGRRSNGAGKRKLEVRPGAVFEGDITTVDLSGGLAALHSHVAELRELLSANSQIPAEALGRVKASDVPSGVTLVIAWSSLKRLVRKMRLVRERLYPLLWSFQQRLTIANGSFDSGGDQVFDVKVAFGAFMPTDAAGLIQQVVALVTAKLLTPRTALTLLVEEGILDVDIDEEVKALDAAGAEAAKRLLDLTRPPQDPNPPPAPPDVPPVPPVK